MDLQLFNDAKERFMNAYNGNPEKEQPDDTKQEPTEPVQDVKPENTEPTVQTFNIDGEELTLEQIKEFKQGYMRQSDYTRKTQELALQRKQVEQPQHSLPNEIEVADGNNYQQNHLEKQIEDLRMEMIVQKTTSEIEKLKAKYPDFDEVAVLNEAEQRGIIDDLEFVYKGMKQADTNNINIEEIKQQAIQEYLNNQVPTSIISTTDSSTEPVDYSSKLSSFERAYCNKRGIDHKSYFEMKSAEYKL